MKKATLFLAAILFSVLSASSQTNKETLPSKDAMFCGKIGESGKTGGNYTVAELQKCDWKISTVDTDYTVIEFQMSLVPKDDTYRYSEHKVKGNTIPEMYRKQILAHTQNIFLEYIKAVNKKDESISVKPMAVRIQP